MIGCKECWKFKTQNRQTHFTVYENYFFFYFNVYENFGFSLECTLFFESFARHVFCYENQSLLQTVQIKPWNMPCSCLKACKKLKHQCEQINFNDCLSKRKNHFYTRGQRFKQFRRNRSPWGRSKGPLKPASGWTTFSKLHEFYSFTYTVKKVLSILDRPYIIHKRE